MMIIVMVISRIIVIVIMRTMTIAMTIIIMLMIMILKRSGLFVARCEMILVVLLLVFGAPLLFLAINQQLTRYAIIGNEKYKSIITSIIIL